MGLLRFRHRGGYGGRASPRRQASPDPHLDRLTDRLDQQLIWVAAFLSALLSLSALTYHLVELPGQRLARRLLARESGPPTGNGPVVPETPKEYEAAARRGRHRLVSGRQQPTVAVPADSQKS